MTPDSTMQTLMQSWKSHIEEGNRCFTDQNFDHAINEYEASKANAYALFDEWPDPDQATATVIVSCHNLAELYSRLNKSSLAYQQLEEANRFLCTELQKSGATYPERLLAIQRGVGKTRQALLYFAKEHGIQLNDHLDNFKQMPN